MQHLLPLLASSRRGSPAGSACPAHTEPLPDVRASWDRAPPRAVPRLLHVLVPAWPRAPARTVEAAGRMTDRICRTCGRVCGPGQLRRGRCPMCTMYCRTHGVERPPRPPRGAATLRACIQCGQRTMKPMRDRCGRCYSYRYRHGVERPLNLRSLPPTHPCQTCEQPTLRRRPGRCSICAQYWRRTGHERPQRLWQHRAGLAGVASYASHDCRIGGAVDSATTTAARTCRICGRAYHSRQERQGRCPMCAQYWRRHGCERPPGPPRAAATLRPCAHCGRPTMVPTRSRCATCYRYRRRFGRERTLPKQPSPPPALRPCQTCGQLGTELRRGRCKACAQYWYQHSRERPQQLW
jgi:hypothetical protein